MAGNTTKMKAIASGSKSVVTKTSNPGKVDYSSGDSVGNGKPGVSAQGEMHFSGTGGSELG